MNRPTLEELLENPAKAEGLSAEELAVNLLKVTALQSNLAARLVAHPMRPKEPPIASNEQDRWLTAEEAAPLIGVTPRWFYRNWKRLDYAKKLSPKVLRFSENGIRRQIRTGSER